MSAGTTTSICVSDHVLAWVSAGPPMVGNTTFWGCDPKPEPVMVTVLPGQVPAGPIELITYGLTSGVR